MSNTDKDKAYRDLLLFLVHIKVITLSIAIWTNIHLNIQREEYDISGDSDLAGVLPDIDREEG